MPTESRPHDDAKHWQDCTDVYDFLDRLRLRPRMWLPGGSLHDLQTMRIGYQVALGVHSKGSRLVAGPRLTRRRRPGSALPTRR